MDFWTRLIGGTGAQRRRSTLNDPQQRLARFKRVYNQILNTWHKTTSLATDPAALDTIRQCFQRLTSILTEESRSPAPHLCLSFSSSSQIFTAVSRIASTSHNEAVVREAVGVFGALIDSEEEEFLANERFAEALMTFLSKIANSQSLMLGEDTDAEIVELLFGICAKIRLESEILPIWFSSRPKVDKDGSSLVAKAGFAGVTQKEAFPLCYQLIDHVHHEGRIGDFARTGLLYIFETASKSENLEKWIVESDLATLMASGLGALYSQLHRKLSVIHPEKGMPVILALSDYPQVHLPADAESVFSPEFRSHMDTFLSYLAFWQDVLEHCRSFDVRHTLIDHFQVLFLQQLLYPSLLESSDVDGGSAVAVLTYLRRILDALDHPELVHMILRYLLDLPEEQPERPRSPVAMRRRSTLILMAQHVEDDDRLNPSLFNLVDLLLSSTQSKNPQTVISALKLVSVILSKNHRHATGTLVTVTEVHNKEPQRTIGSLNAEIQSYLTLASDMIPGAQMDQEYEAMLKDALSLLEAHPCSLKNLALNGLNLPSQAAVDYLTAEARKNDTLHYLTTGDALFKSLMINLATFFTNNVEANLSLTEVIVHLASCPNLRLEGWLSVEPAKYQFDPSETFDDEEDENMRNIYRARRKPTWAEHHAPSLLTALKSLHKQIEILREVVPNFDEHVANRKQAFRMHDEINQAMKAMANFPPPPPVPPTRSYTDAPTPSPWAPQQIAKHVFESSSPNRSQSPRGRRILGERRPTASAASPPSSRPPPVSRMMSQASRFSSSGSSTPTSRSRALSSPAPMPSVMETANMVENAGILTRVIRFPLKVPEKKKDNKRHGTDKQQNGRPGTPSKHADVPDSIPEALEDVAEEPNANGDTIQEEPEDEEAGDATTNATQFSSAATQQYKPMRMPRARASTEKHVRPATSGADGSTPGLSSIPYRSALQEKPATASAPMTKHPEPEKEKPMASEQPAAGEEKKEQKREEQQQTEPFPEAPSEPFPAAPSEPFPEAPSEPFPEAPSEPFPAAPSEPFPAAPSEPFPAAPSEPFPAAPSESFPDAPSEPFPDASSEPFPAAPSEPFPDAPPEPFPSAPSGAMPGAPEQQQQQQRGQQQGQQEGEEGSPREATLSHILTNVIILQEFVLELVALLQVRASLFQEVRFA
ncbi:uncharacterized protein K452DRAFT_296513 [Aplosporella prunicola CBS 121167]|uniref:FHF complex subunit HOOK-interacting protein C-terminal domain-containing protein n=1 Tax=Aplosporella prunicola CBS 121167 TaxID=1176127 RepID=A0A6A6BJW6_9PEZI|nr:uncharacterized protein K452DRAFT_296513 [Aplosporella prunicola CBS 121167]KAF2144316.1 hypothetical protein K452DRAFT_296513 [Aplosporella prunicola CBS 121167]